MSHQLPTQAKLVNGQLLLLLWLLLLLFLLLWLLLLIVAVLLERLGLGGRTDKIDNLSAMTQRAAAATRVHDRSRQLRSRLA